MKKAPYFIILLVLTVFLLNATDEVKLKSEAMQEPTQPSEMSGKSPQLSIVNQERLINSPQAMEEHILINQQRYQQHQFPWLISLFIFIFLMGIWNIKRIKKFTVLFRKKDEIYITPETIAIDALKKLHKMNFSEGNTFKEFYIALSKIIRSYMESRFKITATSQTTEEIIGSLKAIKEMETATQEVWQRLFEKADLVKFSQYQPSAIEIENDISITEKNIFQFVGYEKK